MTMSLARRGGRNIDCAYCEKKKRNNKCSLVMLHSNRYDTRLYDTITSNTGGENKPFISSNNTFKSKMRFQII